MPGPAANPRVRLLRSAAVWLFLLLGTAAGLAQTNIPIKIKGFKFPGEFYPPPNQTQAKTLVEGAVGEMLPDKRFQVSEARLQTFLKDGTRELLVQTPLCFFDPAARVLDSPGLIEAQTGDNKFSMSGEGFLWRQTNSSLTISNRVHTIVHTAGLTRAGINPAPQPAQGTNDILEITSDRFDYLTDSGLGVYRGNVRVRGVNLSVDAAVLTLEVPLRERALQSVTAEGDVVLDYALAPDSRVHATGGRAVYAADTGLVHVTGEPAWQWQQREGRGDDFVIDQTNKIVRATGRTWLKLPVSPAGQTAFLAPRPAGAPAPPAGTNAFLEITSSRYEITTNLALFRGPVEATHHTGDQTSGTLNCDMLTVYLAGTNQIQSLVADENVRIHQDDNQFTSGRAVYTATNGVLELTRRPAWQAGQHSGKGDVITIDAPRDEMLVAGNAAMRFPAGELGSLAGLSPSNAPAIKTRPTAAQFAEIFSDRYRLQSRRDALFEGGVYISHPNVNWACETLDVQLPEPGGRVEKIVSHQSVIFELVDEQKRRIHGSGDKAVYIGTFTSAATNEVLELTGNPCWLRSYAANGATNGLVRSPVLVLDLARRKAVIPPGNWAIRGAAPAPGLDAIGLPERFKRKP